MVKYGILRKTASIKYYLRPALGLLFMVLAVTGFLLWENMGREAFKEETVLVASLNIERGHIMKEKDITEVSITKKLIPEGALKKTDFQKLETMEAKQFISKNSPLVLGYFEESNTKLEKGHSFFTIPKEWIFTRSSTLRRGDTVDIYRRSDLFLIGTYKVGYVKDQEDKEIKSKDEMREESTGTIHHIEVECTFSDYKVLMEEADLGETLILVQRNM